MNWAPNHFRLNGRWFQSEEELIQYALNISKPLHHFIQEWFSGKDTIIVKTSGSTGKPKEIRLRKEYMVNSAKATGMFFNLPESTTALCCLPIEYIAGKMMIVRALTLGWHLDVVEPSSHPLENIHQRYDFSAMVPLQLQNSLEKIEFIDQLIVGGGVVSHSLRESIQQVSTKIYATYGMTETITHIAVRELNRYSDVDTEPHYQTLPNVSIRTDERNCLVIHAPKVSDELIVTNDIVELISETEFEWKGRYDNVINSGGIKLHPEEIEEKLSPYISSRFFVAGIPDEQLGEKLVLIIEGEKEDSFSMKSLLQVTDIKESLSRFQIPKAVFFFPNFIETPTGKIQRKETIKQIGF
jgi:O-succinylbenzoic acid--CoA ligase